MGKSLNFDYVEEGLLALSAHRLRSFLSRDVAKHGRGAATFNPRARLNDHASPGSKELILEFSRLEKQPNVLRGLSRKKSPLA